MKKEFIKCEYCSIPIAEACQLAAYRTVIDGKEYIFCCKKCAERYAQKRET
ncbi:transcriptional regulator [Candidatus Bathyarchaeota archaeon]|nr:transcriptional regulator [Candidatus Bathyarchaeota archaeon]